MLNEMNILAATVHAANTHSHLTMNLQEQVAMADDIISRAEAKAQGLKFYFTGKPCVRGHISERYLSGGCAQCQRDKAAQFRADNPETAKEINARYRAAHLDKIREYVRKWNAANKEFCRTMQRQWALNNPDRVRASWRKYHEANRDKINQRAALRNQLNPAVKRANKLKRRAIEVNAPGSHTAADLVALLAAQRGKCAYCRKAIGKRYHVDHIIPLSKGGSNDPNNLQLTCKSCNSSKGFAHPIEFARRRGLLL